MTFITSTAFLCTTISAVTIQILSTSSETKKGNKKGVASGSLDTSLLIFKHTPEKKPRTIKTKIVKQTNSRSKCNILKIHDFILYPIKTTVAVTDAYIVNNNNNLIPITIKSVVKKSLQQINKKISNLTLTPKLCKPVRLKKINLLKNKRKRPKNFKSLKATKDLSPKRIKQKIKRTKSKEKRTNTLTSQNSSAPASVHAIKMVLSPDQFIFKPAIPIIETNYPLDNAEKIELYAQEVPIDKVLSYSFTDPAIKNYIKFPSVSKIIEETISDKTKQILANWRQKMIDDLGEEGFYNHSEALKVRGTEFHMAVRNAVLGKTTENCSEVTQNSLKSLSWMLEHISNPMAVESTIAHPKLGYRGVADCIAMFRNIPVMIDWKLSDKPKRDLKDTYDAPVQITAYIGALNHDPNYKWGVNHGLVAVAYANGDPCDVFLLAPKHCQIYWRHWLMRFDKFKARSHLHLEHNIDEKSLELI